MQNIKIEFSCLYTSYDALSDEHADLLEAHCEKYHAQTDEHVSEYCEIEMTSEQVFALTTTLMQKYADLDLHEKHKEYGGDDARCNETLQACLDAMKTLIAAH